jgi:hypothetical protein
LKWVFARLVDAVYQAAEAAKLRFLLQINLSLPERVEKTGVNHVKT